MAVRGTAVLSPSAFALLSFFPACAIRQPGEVDDFNLPVMNTLDLLGLKSNRNAEV